MACRPTAYFCTPHELRMVFIVLNNWKKRCVFKEYFMTHETFSVYQYVAVPILHGVYGYSPETVTEVGSCNRDPLAPKA